MKRKKIKNNSILKIFVTIITITWMCIIFAFSNQKANKSKDYSNSLVKSTIVNIYKIFNNNPTEEEINNIIDTWDYPVRKMAHFTEYLILGILIFCTLRLYNVKNIYIMILLCYLYAVSDEVHQLFVVGRSCKIIDIMIDTLGSTIGILILNKRIKKNEMH